MGKNSRSADQYERFFVAQTDEAVVASEEQDAYISDCKGWPLDELKTSKEMYVPRSVAKLMPDILKCVFQDTPSPWTLGCRRHPIHRPANMTRERTRLRRWATLYPQSEPCDARR